MNDTVTHELEVLVERSVRPVRAPFATKKRMREDLLSHLSSTFEDEFTKSDDETESLRLTRERFGNPVEISRELQQSVPRHHEFSCWFEQTLAQQPGESFLHLVFKHQMVAGIYFGLIAALGLVFQLHRGDPGLMLWVFGIIMIVSGLTGSMMQWLTDQMGRTLLNPKAQRSRRLKWRYGLLSLVIFPGYLFLNYLGLGFGPGIESLTPSREAYLSLPALALLGLLTVYLMGPKSAERTLYQEKWAGLDVAEE